MRYVEDRIRFATLQEALENENVDELKKLLALCNTAERPTRKAAIIEIILAQMRGDILRATWNRLDTLQQAAVSEAVYAADSRYNKARFIAKYGKEPNFGASAQRHGYSYGYTPSLLGLFLHSNMLPEDLKAQLQSFVPAPPPLTLQTVEEVPSVYDLITTSYDYLAKKKIEESTPLAVTMRDTERDALHEIPTVLRLISTGKVAVSEKTQQPTATAVKAIGALLSNGDYYDNIAILADEDSTETETTEAEPENAVPPADTPQSVEIRRGSLREIIEDEDEEVGPIRAFAWPLLTQSARLTALTGKKLALSPAGQKALVMPTHEVARSLWQNWLKSDIFDELRRINAIRGQTGNGKTGLTKPATRRAAIVQTLQQCPAGKWVNINAFLRYLRAEHDFTVSRDEWALYISEAQYGSLGGADTWNILQARYTLCFLFEYAATLGLIDVAYMPPAEVRDDYGDFWGADDHAFFSRYDGLLYIRVNALGAYCLGLAQTYTPPIREQETVLRVLPNRDVVITDLRAASGDVLILGLYAEKTSERVYRLDQARMLAAVESGRALQELRELLTTRSAEPLPPVIERFLQDVEDRSQRVQDRGAARLIECADGTTAQLIAHDPRTKRYCLAAGERHVIVPADSEAAFRKGLRQLGYILPPARPERK
jgi:hypothetical protein